MEVFRTLIVIPTFNNRDTLRHVVIEALEVGLPVLVVNDGTTEGSMQALAGLAIHKIEHLHNLGKGAAIQSAGRWAAAHDFTHIITLDADGQHNPRDVQRFIGRIAQNSGAIIVGTRDLSGRDVPGASRFGRRFSNFWVKVACGMSLPDSQSGFRVYPVAVVTQVKCQATRYDYEIEILVRSVWAGATLDSIDISVRYDEESKHGSHFDPWWDNVRISWAFTRLVARNFLPWPHKVLIDDPSRTGEKLTLKHWRKSLLILLRERTAPRSVAAAIMLGIFLGTLPLIACHSVAIIFCATRLRLNRLIALNISHLCAPPVVPALAIEAGFFLRNGRFLTEFSLQTLGYQIHQRLLDYLLGSVLLAPILALVTGGTVHGLVWLYQAVARRRKVHGEAEPTTGYRSPNYGGYLGHAIFHCLIRWFGVRPAYVLLAGLLPYYVLLRPRARRLTSSYLSHRFPDLNSRQRFLKSIRYLYSFGQVLIDQAAMGILGPGQFKVEFPEAPELKRRAHAGHGLILLTTHVGSWQAAMANMSELGVPVHFQLQVEPHTAGRHFFDIARQRKFFRIVSPKGFLGGLVELTSALHAGQCVAVMGDRAWGGRTCAAEFLGEHASFPIAPYHLCMATGANIIVLLTARTGMCEYRICQSCITVGGELAKMPREAVIDALLRQYVRCVEEHLERYPLMWFNFFDFWQGSQDTIR